METIHTTVRSRRRSRPGASVPALLVAVFVIGASCAPPPPPPTFVGSPVTARPVGTTPAPHPHMADTAASTMHANASNTSAHTPAGPLGNGTVVSAHDYGGLCAAQAFDSQGRLFTVCGSLQGFALHVIDTTTMRPLASLPLPQRPSTPQALFEGDLSLIFTDTSGGAYFYLDDRERVVLVDADQVLRVIEFVPGPVTGRLVDVVRIDLVDQLHERDCFDVPANLRPTGHCDAITSVIPDWSGRLWFISRHGIVGTVDPGSGAVRTLTLVDEEIENSAAVDPSGVYVVSDKAVYGMVADAQGSPTIDWREPYDHSGGPRPGQLALGSGTTPTLVGDDLLAITDGADPVNVVVMRLSPGLAAPRTMCSVPVFEPGASASEDSLVTDGESAVVVQNTYGYEDPFSLPPGTSVVGGSRRIDIDRESGECDITWSNDEPVPSAAMKLSLGAGLVYGYAKVPDPAGRDVWYWVAIDWRTGQTAHRVLAGVGPQWNNNWGVISIGPDGSAYMGTMSGLLRIRDTA